MVSTPQERETPAMTTRSSIYSDQGQRGAANLTATHLHDLGITISIGDLEPAQLGVVRSILRAEVDALVERVNAATFHLTGQAVYWDVTLDGAARCGEHA
jgi:hypothetical protein